MLHCLPLLQIVLESFVANLHTTWVWPQVSMYWLYLYQQICASESAKDIVCFFTCEIVDELTLNDYSIPHFYSYGPINSDTTQSSCLLRSYCCESSFFLFFFSQTFRSFTRHGCAKSHRGIGLLTKVRSTTNMSTQTSCWVTTLLLRNRAISSNPLSVLRYCHKK